MKENHLEPGGKFGKVGRIILDARRSNVSITTKAALEFLNVNVNAIDSLIPKAARMHGKMSGRCAILPVYSIAQNPRRKYKGKFYMYMDLPQGRRKRDTPNTTDLYSKPDKCFVEMLMGTEWDSSAKDYFDWAPFIDLKPGGAYDFTRFFEQVRRVIAKDGKGYLLPDDKGSIGVNWVSSWMMVRPRAAMMTMVALILLASTIKARTM